MSKQPDFENTALPDGLVMRVFRREQSPTDFEQAIRIRTEIFVDEQNIPADLELDEYDDEALHWLILREADLEPVATGRMISYQEGCQMRPVAKIERISVVKAARGQKLGNWLMREILKTVISEGFDQAILDAHSHLRPFYEKLGFQAEGDEFWKANVRLYRMRLVFTHSYNRSNHSI